LRDLKSYEKALEYCDLGIELCIELKTTKSLGRLYTNKAELYGYLEDKEKAQYYFYLACDQLVKNKEPELAELVKNAALSLFNIKVEYQLLKF
jgi:hypothetical protein